jgi:hypothetical protein
MGIVACFASVSEDTLARFREDSDEFEEFLYPDDGDVPNSVDIDKSWDAIHYLLTGEGIQQTEDYSEPQTLAINGGEEFGPDVGYGPARFLLPDQVAAVSKVLTKLTKAELKRRFNTNDMIEENVYLSHSWEDDEKAGLSYVLEYFKQLTTFYRAAAERGDAVIQWLC